jgi:vacuolar-type H+-ATPase subunit F/Vma7
MGRIVAIGEEAHIMGFALAGVVVYPATDVGAVRAAWEGLRPDDALVILTPAAAEALGDEVARTRPPLTAVMPR